MIRLPEEILVFGRMSAFGLIVGTVYWFVAYEPAGTMLLIGFGIATALAAVVLWAKSSHALGGTDAWPLGHAPEGIPAPALAPFGIGVGAGIVALGLAFGPLLALTGLVIALIGARYWLDATMREADSSEARDRRSRPPS